MTATAAPSPAAQPEAPLEPTYRRIPFPAPVAERVRGLRRLLGGVPLGVAPLGFLVTFVTLMTYVPDCSGHSVTSSTSLSGRDVLAGQAHGVVAPAPVQHGLHAAAPWAQAVLVACLVLALIVLVVPRYPATAAAVAGGVVVLLLGRMESELGSGHYVDTQAELGEILIWMAALLALVAGITMHRWQSRPVTPWARCAGFWRRLLAFIIDVQILLLVLAVVMVVSATAAVVLAVPLLLVYWPAWEASRYRATPGKQTLGLAVTMDDGSSISRPRCAARHALRFVSIVTLIGAALAGVDQSGKALHDIACHTVVVRGVDPIA